MRASSFAFVAALSIAPSLAHAAAGDWAKSQASGRFGGQVESRTWGSRFSLFAKKATDHRELGLTREDGTLSMRVTETLGPGMHFTSTVSGQILSTRTTAEGDTVLKVHFDERASSQRAVDTHLNQFLVAMPIKAAEADATFTFKKDGTLSLDKWSSMTRDHAYSLYAPAHATLINALWRKTARSHAKGVLAPLP